MFTIEDARIKCNEKKIKWSQHQSMRMMQRGITREDVLRCIDGGEIIEEYPDHWLNPAALVFGHSVKGRIMHVVIGMDEYIHIITSYFPDETKFESDMKTRKEKK